MTFHERRIERRDLAQRVAWLNDPAVYQALAVRGRVNLPTTVAWYERTREDSTRVDLVLADSHDRPVMMYGVILHAPQDQSCNGYFFAPAHYQGQGAGSTAVERSLYWAFDFMNAYRFELWSMGDNERARRLYARYGFRVEGRLRQALLRDGFRHDRIVQTLRRPEWLAYGAAVASDVLERDD